MSERPPLPPVRTTLAGIDIAWMVGLLVAVVVLGGLYVQRSVFLETYLGDTQVYFRAAWAAWAGQDIYAIEDDKGQLYAYPPFLALVLIPLADPPADAGAVWAVPWPATVVMWYALNVVLLWWGVCLAAGAVERRWADSWVGRQPRYGLWWWLIRAAPVLFASVAIGRSMVRGQMGSILILSLCGMAAGLMDRRHVRAGLWLALAICIKVIPAYLLLYPLWRRDWKCIGGCMAGLAAGLVILPLLVIGPRATWDAYDALLNEVLLPGALGSEGEERANELTAQNSTDSNSIKTTLHNLQHFWTVNRRMRPPTVDTWVKVAHWGSAAMLTGLTLAAAGWRRPGSDTAASVLLFLGSLTIVHMVISPIFHPHYFALSVVPIMGLLVYIWQYRKPFPDLGGWWQALLWSNVVIHAVTAMGFRWLRDGGLVLWGALLMWGVCTAVLWRAVRVEGRAGDQPAGLSSGWEPSSSGSAAEASSGKNAAASSG